MKSVSPKVVILSGGPNSVHLEGAPRVPDGFFEWAAENKIAVLGICYGMQVCLWCLPFCFNEHPCRHALCLCRYLLNLLKERIIACMLCRDMDCAWLPQACVLMARRVRLFVSGLLQMITHMLGGEVQPAAHGGEYGRMPIDIEPNSQLFAPDQGSGVNVWMSHGDEAVKLPEGFTAVAKSRQVRHRNCFKRAAGIWGCPSTNVTIAIANLEHPRCHVFRYTNSQPVLLLERRPTLLCAVLCRAPLSPLRTPPAWSTASSITQRWRTRRAAWR